MTSHPPPAELVPHSGRAVLLDEVLEADEQRIRCRVVVRRDSAFLEDGRVPAVVVLEYMAQAIAALAGLLARASGRPPRVGFLLGSREFRLFADAFAVGDEILVEAVRVFGDESIGSFECSATRQGEPVASGTLNVFLASGPKETP
ncbi:MAG TPA: 3-hydroxylacyl-ACP dehydratase [Anaeromyxobacteraceae bacterium]|nr:3-hydroxylacyl-ACP dehydratase [Anaeromyxobacteraceae bacterium]